MTEQKAEQQLTILKGQYVKSLPSYAKTLNENWRRLRHFNWELAPVKALYETAHKLAGSGTTFGFPRITVDARALEQLLQPMLAQESSPKPSHREPLEAALNVLLKSIDEVVSGQVPGKSMAPATTAALSPEQPASHAHIAIVEDDTLLAMQLTNWLQQAGFSITHFTSPGELEYALQQHHFDLLLLDIAFPDAPFGGVAWLESTRHLLNPHQPVAIMSARTDMLARLRALRAGAASYLIKPLDRASLEITLTQLTRRPEDNRERVLLVDDDIDLTGLYSIALEEAGFSVRALNQPLTILDVLERHRPDIIVLDYQMPGINGAEIATLLRQEQRYMDIPIIFLSGDPKAIDQQRALGIVGNAFLRKPLIASQLIDTLRHHLAQARAIKARIRLSTMRQRADGLQNRAYFFAELEAAIAAAAHAEHGRYNELLAQVTVTNSAYLKQRYGLVSASALNTRIENYLASLSITHGRGSIVSDFTYLLRLNVPAHELPEQVLNDLLTQLNTTQFLDDNGPRPEFIIGGVVLDATIGDTERAVKSAEEACAQILAEHRSSGALLAISGESVRKPVDQRMRSAIDAGQFKLHFQPIVSLGDNEPIYEVLVRLVDEVGVEYLPTQFFNYIETYTNDGLSMVDRWVIEHTVAHLQQLGGKQAESNRVVVKLSPAKGTLNKLQFYIANVMQNSRLRFGRRVYFSLKTDFALHHPQELTAFIRGMHDLDCGVMLENYPVNDATLDLFNELPAIDMLKLDPAWNRKIEARGETADLLRRLQIRLGQEVRLVASAVEDSNVFIAYWELGLRDFQGYFVQQPGERMSHESPDEKLNLFI